MDQFKVSYLGNWTVSNALKPSIINGDGTAAQPSDINAHGFPIC